MKKTVLLILVSLSGLLVTAQEITASYKRGPELNDPYKRTKVLAIDDDGSGGVIIARMYGSWMGTDFGYYAEHYNDKFVKVKSYAAEGEDDALSAGAVISDGIINYIEYGYDRKQKSLVIYTNQGNVKDMKFARKPFITIPQEKNKNATVKVTPFDSKNISLICVDINTGAGVDKGEKHKVYVINNKLDILIESELNKNFDKGEYKVMAMNISQDNKALYLVGKTLIQKPAKNTPDYSYDITKVTNGNSKTVQTFKAGNNHVSQIEVAVTQDKVVCVGIYSEGEDEWQKGFCYFAMEPEKLDITVSKQLPFTDDMLKLYNDKKLRDELRKFEGRDLFVTANGDFIYNAEQYDTETTGSKNPVTYFYYGSILSAKISKDGELDRISTIKKMQGGNGTAEYTFSYVPFIKDNDMYFFINGEIKNKDGVSIVHAPSFTGKGVNFNVVKIGGDGNIEYKEVIDGTKEKLWTITNFNAFMATKKISYFMSSNNDTTEKRALKIEL